MKCLEEEGIEYIFGVPGEENADLPMSCRSRSQTRSGRRVQNSLAAPSLAFPLRLADKVCSDSRFCFPDGLSTEGARSAKECEGRCIGAPANTCYGRIQHHDGERAADDYGQLRTSRVYSPKPCLKPDTPPDRFCGSLQSSGTQAEGHRRGSRLLERSPAGRRTERTEIDA